MMASCVFSTKYCGSSPWLILDFPVRLHRAVAALPKAERELIRAIYFDGLTEQDHAQATGMSQTGVSYRRRKNLSKLKVFLDIMGSFC